MAEPQLMATALSPSQQLVLHALGAELFIHNGTGEYYWRGPGSDQPALAGAVDAWANGDVGQQVSRFVSIRFATGQERVLLGVLLRKAFGSHPIPENLDPIPETPHTVALAAFSDTLHAQLPCNASLLRPLVLALLQTAPPAALSRLQTLDVIELRHVPTGQYFLQLVAMITGTPSLLKKKRSQQLESQHIEHLEVRVRSGTTGQEEVKRLPRALGLVSLLLLVAAAVAGRPLRFAEGTPLHELYTLVASTAATTWLGQYSDVFPLRASMQ